MWRRQSVLVAIAVLHSSPALGAPTRILVQTSTFSDDLKQALRAELPADVLVESPPAELRAKLTEVGDVLELRVLDIAGIVLVDREVGSANAPKPAIRRSVVSILEVRDAAEFGKERKTIAPPTATVPATLRVGAGLQTRLWNGPTTPQLGLAARVSLDFSPWVFTMGAEWSGLCCALEFTEELRAQTDQLGGWIGAEYRFVEGVVALSLLQEIGLDYIRADVDAIGFAGETRPERHTQFEPGLRTGLAVVWWPLRKWVFVELRGGVAVSLRRFRVRLPAPEEFGQATLDRGVVMPYGQLTVGSAIF